MKTSKGTELPIIRLKGKDYLEVKYRLVWFREERPLWAIQTELLKADDKEALARAIILDESGRVVATAHKKETKSGFADFIEKAETGAIGRALALIGYGTQFCADELDEGERIVDSPVVKSNKPTVAKANAVQSIIDAPSDDLGSYVCKFGKKHKGKALKEIDPDELHSFVQWLTTNIRNKDGVTKEFIEKASIYLELVSA